MSDPLVPAVIGTVDLALRSFFLSPAIEPHFTTPDEVHEAIRGLKVSKAPGPNGVPNSALSHLPKRAVSLLSRIFNAVLRTNDFPQTWKHAGVISIVNRRRIQHYPLPIGPLVSWTQLSNYLKRSN